MVFVWEAVCHALAICKRPLISKYVGSIMSSLSRSTLHEQHVVSDDLQYCDVWHCVVKGIKLRAVRFGGCALVPGDGCGGGRMKAVVMVDDAWWVIGVWQAVGGCRACGGWLAVCLAGWLAAWLGAFTDLM